MPEYDEVQQSGLDGEQFATGSQRDTRAGKGRYDLLSPFTMRRLAKHFENGADKYGDRNWEKGQPISRYADSAIRHMFNYLEGQQDEDHLAAAMWNVGAMIDHEERFDPGHAVFDLPWMQTAAKAAAGKAAVLAEQYLSRDNLND